MRRAPDLLLERTRDLSGCDWGTEFRMGRGHGGYGSAWGTRDTSVLTVVSDRLQVSWLRRMLTPLLNRARQAVTVVNA
jgi:hypothetical protein